MDNNKISFSILTPPTDKEIDLILDSLRSNYSTYIHNFWSALGSTLLFMGWILTTEEARKVFAQHPNTVYVVTGVLILLILGHSQIAIRFFKKSKQITSTLEMYNVKSLCYNNYHISVTRVVVNLFIVASLLLVDLWLVWICDIITDLPVADITK